MGSRLGAWIKRAAPDNARSLVTIAIAAIVAAIVARRDPSCETQFPSRPAPSPSSCKQPSGAFASEADLRLSGCETLYGERPAALGLCGKDTTGVFVMRRPPNTAIVVRCSLNVRLD